MGLRRIHFVGRREDGDVVIEDEEAAEAQMLLEEEDAQGALGAGGGLGVLADAVVAVLDGQVVNAQDGDQQFAGHHDLFVQVV